MTINAGVDLEFLTSSKFFHPVDAVSLNPAVDLFFIIQGNWSVISVYSFAPTLIWSQSISCTTAKWSTDGTVLIVSFNDGSRQVLHRDTGEALCEVEETLAIFDARTIQRETFLMIFDKQKASAGISSAAQTPAIPIISFKCFMQRPISAWWADHDRIAIFNDETIEIFPIDTKVLLKRQVSKHSAYQEELKFLLRSFGNIFEEIKSNMHLVEKAFCQMDLEVLQSDARNANTRLYSRLKPMVDGLRASLKDCDAHKALYHGLLAALQRLEDDWIDMLALLKLLQDDHSSMENFYEIATSTWLAKWLIFFAHPEYTQAKYLQSLAEKVDDARALTSKAPEVFACPLASLSSPGHIDSIFPAADSSFYAVYDKKKHYRVDCLNFKIDPVYAEASENAFVLPVSLDSHYEVINNTISVRKSASEGQKIDFPFEPRAVSYSSTKKSLLILSPNSTSINLYRVIHE